MNDPVTPQPQSEKPKGVPEVVKINCPKCGELVATDRGWWHGHRGLPVHCRKCDNVFWCAIQEETWVLRQGMAEELPALEEGTRVYLDNKEHRFHLAPGMIVCRDHKHYRVQLSVNDGKRTRTMDLWVPEHWAKPMPMWL